VETLLTPMRVHQHQDKKTAVQVNLYTLLPHFFRWHSYIMYGGSSSSQHKEKVCNHLQEHAGW
jgi:hypothetical protein